MQNLRRIFVGLFIALTLAATVVVIPSFGDLVPKKAVAMGHDCPCDEDCRDASNACMMTQCHVAGALAAEKGPAQYVASCQHGRGIVAAVAYRSIDRPPPLHPPRA